MEGAREFKKLKKKSSILNKLERCLSTSRRNKQQLATPMGYFSVYVGPERQRFVIKTEFANHPLFKMLLEDAELEYGFTSEGPLLLPCEVDLFCKVLAEMDRKDFDDEEDGNYPNCGSCSPFNPARRRLGKSTVYTLLTPPRLHEINHI